MGPDCISFFVYNHFSNVPPTSLHSLLLPTTTTSNKQLFSDAQQICNLKLAARMHVIYTVLFLRIVDQVFTWAKYKRDLSFCFDFAIKPADPILIFFSW